MMFEIPGKGGELRFAILQTVPALATGLGLRLFPARLRRKREFRFRARAVYRKFKGLTRWFGSMKRGPAKE